jgi:hypothetical protein
MEVAPKGLQEVNARGQSSEALFAAEAADQAEEAHRLVSLRGGLG